MQAAPQHPSDLELDQDPTFSARQYRLQQAGRIAFAIILLAAIAGFFGGGPIASVSRSSDDGSLQVDYDRFLRRDNSSTITIELTAPPDASEVRLGIDQPWFESVSVTGVAPEPDRQESRNGTIEFVFPVSEPGSLMQVIVTYSAKHAGTLETAIATGDDQSVGVWQFIFP